MNKELFLRQLKERGLKLTPQRRAIIDALVETRHLHPSADLVFREGKRIRAGLSLSTVYATLNAFCRNGLIRVLEFDRMENRYELSFEEHVNLVCRACGIILDVGVPFSFDPEAVERETGFQVLEKRLEYYGLCRDCARKKEGTKRRKNIQTARTMKGGKVIKGRR